MAAPPSPTGPTAADIAAARAALAAADPALAAADAATPAFVWRARPGGFSGLFRMIVEQQVSVASADAVWGRLVAGIGRPDGSVAPEALLEHDAAALRVFGLSRQKAAYGLDIARAQVEGRIDLEHMGRLPDDRAIAALTALRGVGPWTAEAYLMMCEGRLDVFPGGDVALQEAIRWIDGLDVRPTEKQAYARAEAWRPFRAVATHLLWAWYVAVRRGDIPHPRPPAGAA